MQSGGVPALRPWPAGLRAQVLVNSGAAGTEPAATPSVCPGALAPEAKIVSVGFAHRPSRRRLTQVVSNAIALGVGDGLFRVVERQANLRLHVGRTGPPHQRVDLARFFRF